jgi:hypothetical protein
MEYKAYSIMAFEEQPGRWFAKIERLDGRPIKRVGVVGAKESITTPTDIPRKYGFRQGVLRLYGVGRILGGLGSQRPDCVADDAVSCELVSACSVA